MPIHDWRRVHAGTYHDFHTSWISELKKQLNKGLLPEGFYAMSEQTAGDTGPDVLTLQVDAPGEDAFDVPEGGTAVAIGPPRVSFRVSLSEEEIYTRRRRTLTIRHVSGDRVVALHRNPLTGKQIQPCGAGPVLDKAVAVLNHGCHLLLVDPFPPGAFDPEGIHEAIWSQFCRSVWQQPADKPLTLAAYTGGMLPHAYVEPIGPGAVLPDMPLFLDEDWYVNVPLEATYTEAYTTVPRRWRDVIEGAADAESTPDMTGSQFASQPNRAGNGIGHHLDCDPVESPFPQFLAPLDPAPSRR